MPTDSPRVRPTRVRAVRARTAALTLAGGLALVVGVGACGGGTPGGTASGPTPTAATPTPSGATPSPTGRKPTPTVSSSALPLHDEISVTGEVIEGLRPQCVVLQTANRRFVLTGAPVRTLHSGDRVAVVGVPRPDLLSPCGAILVVTHAAVR
jgi:hypothetical protein